MKAKMFFLFCFYYSNTDSIHSDWNKLLNFEYITNSRVSENVGYDINMYWTNWIEIKCKKLLCIIFFITEHISLGCFL